MKHIIQSLLAIVITPSLLFAQGTLEDYNRAYSLRREFTWAKVANHVDDARWIDNTHFQYHLTASPAEATETTSTTKTTFPTEAASPVGDGGALWHFGQVNPDGTITLADSTALHPIPPGSPGALGSFDSARRFHRRDTAATFVANPSRRPRSRHWMETDDERSGDPVLSPDSSLAAFIRDDNVWVARPDGSDAHLLTTEGTLSHHFTADLQWSPDGRYLAATRLRPIEKRYVYYVESSPADQLQPVLHKQEYAKPGDELAQRTPYIIHVATGRAVRPAPDLIANQYSLSRPTWCTDSRAIRFEYNQRGHKLYRLYELPVPEEATPAVATVPLRTLIEERFPTYVNYSAYHFRHDFADGSRILWMSERDGYAHLYSLTPDPSPLFQITRGPWVVRRVLRVDEEAGLIFFTACGMNPDEDPYNIHYYRIRLDGSGLTDLTPEPANHNARFNDDYTALIDTYSTVDTAPVTVVRVVAAPRGAATVLARADLSPLLSSGWVAPEPFAAPGRDGKTLMYGIIQRPTNFDPAKKYPVIEYIYAGPGDAYTPKSFQPYNYYTTALADLGFIVVQLDAMGTSHRGKAFEEVCYKNLKDAGFPDRIAWMRAAAAKYPYMDLDRVGIYGCSAGGQESTAAVLFHGDFYKAAYSACGCHDNRMDKIWWNEQWMGYPVDSSYVECSNVANAYRLERPLMLVVGELDDNVDPASTMQVADALIKANKPFELVVIPGAHHTVGEAYGEHKRFDFFVKHLLDVEPPAWRDVQTR